MRGVDFILTLIKGYIIITLRCKGECELTSSCMWGLLVSIDGDGSPLLAAQGITSQHTQQPSQFVQMPRKPNKRQRAWNYRRNWVQLSGMVDKRRAQMRFAQRMIFLHCAKSLQPWVLFCTKSPGLSLTHDLTLLFISLHPVGHPKLR